MRIVSRIYAISNSKRVVLIMTRKELALALHVSPSQITRYINEKGMPFPISASEARQWHDSVILDQGPRKEFVDEEPQKRSEPQWFRQERQEYQLAKRLVQLDSTSDKLDALPKQYDQLATAVLQSHLELIETAILRRFVSTETSPYEYVSALAGLVAKWQKILSVECDE
jgi:transcriptional regulator with XRE-family HTH domain